MKSIENFVIKTKNGHSILADLYLCKNKKCPVVIYCHGYKGFKDWGHLHLMPKMFANQGIHFLKFNFSHNGGTLDNPIDFPDLESFAKNNYSIELQDLQNVINWITSEKNAFLNRIKTSQIYLMGHSRGGSISILTAANDKRIKKLVTWAAVADFAQRFPSGKKLKKWKEKGVFYIENSRTKQKMPHNFQFYKDFLKNKADLDITEAERSLDIPHLLIHGTADEAVFLGEALHLMSLNERSSLIKLQGAGHTFGGHHPYKKKKLAHHIELALNYTITFFQNE